MNKNIEVLRILCSHFAERGGDYNVAVDAIAAAIVAMEAIENGTLARKYVTPGEIDDWVITPITDAEAPFPSDIVLIVHPRKGT